MVYRSCIAAYIFRNLQNEDHQRSSFQSLGLNPPRLGHFTPSWCCWKICGGTCCIRGWLVVMVWASWATAMATEFLFLSLKLKDSPTEMALPLLTFYKLYIDIDLFIYYIYIYSQYVFLYIYIYLYIYVYLNITQFVGVNQCRRSMVFLSNGDSCEKYHQLSKKVPRSIDADPPTLGAGQLSTPHACDDLRWQELTWKRVSKFFFLYTSCIYTHAYVLLHMPACNSHKLHTVKCSSLDIMTCSICQASVNHHELVQETRRCIQTFQKLKSQEAVSTARRLVFQNHGAPCG